MKPANTFQFTGRVAAEPEIRESKWGDEVKVRLSGPGQKGPILFRVQGDAVPRASALAVSDTVTVTGAFNVVTWTPKGQDEVKSFLSLEVHSVEVHTDGAKAAGGGEEDFPF